MKLCRLALLVVLGACVGLAVAQNHGSSSSSHGSGGGSHYSGGSHSYHSSGSGSYHGSHYSRGNGFHSSGSSNIGNWGYHSGYSATNQFWHGSAESHFRSFNRAFSDGGHDNGHGFQGGHSTIGLSKDANHFNAGGENHFNISVVDQGRHARYEEHGHSNYTGNHNFTGGYHGEISHGNDIHVVHNGLGFGFHAHGWREGYHQYRRDFDDSHFYFGFYLFSPWDTACVVSPWYYYPCLPPYLPADRVIYANDGANWYGGSDYYFNVDADPNSYGNVDLNYALNELVNVFDNGDEYGLGELVDRGADVGVYNDGKYMYSVKGDDFYQMMLDNVHGVQNVNFSISHVRLTDGGAIVNAQHEFTDPDGGNDTVYQEYRLRNEDGHYVVQDFNTSKNPSGARTFF